MITAAGLVDALTPAVVELAQAGEDRPVLGVEIVEAGGPFTAEAGDVVVAVGARDAGEVLALVDAVGAAAGLVLRRTWADDEEVRRRCAAAGLPVLTVADDTAWSSALTVLRSALEAAATGPGRAGDRVYGDLFDMADRVGALLGAPVTIEDAASRVLAYSTGQVDIDAARMSTIVGRRVPREVRDHFRSLGVFRRLATSDEPFFVPAGTGDVRARYVVPVRAGGEQLGSIWAVVDEPVPAALARELGAATEVVALLLLRLRSQSELHRQVQRDQVRSVLQGAVADRPDWLAAPARAAVVAGPESLDAEARCELWVGLARRHGWRHPVIADLDGVLYAVLREEGSGPGTLGWFADVVRAERRTDPAVGLYVGGRAADADALVRSRAEAAELSSAGVGDPEQPVVTVDGAWASLVLARAVDGLGQRPLVSPVVELARARDGATLLATLEAVLDFWGEPQRAAQRLGVHANTVRHRTARITAQCALDLGDPAHRLAARLELSRLRRDGALDG